METKLLWELLPEEFPYDDEGCEVFPSCLNCPLPSCLEEQPRAKQRYVMDRRAEMMLELRREGKGLEEIAGMFAVSRRTVQRSLKEMGGQQMEKSKVKDQDDGAKRRDDTGEA